MRQATTRKLIATVTHLAGRRLAITAGLVDAQLSNDPGGTRWVRHLKRLIDLLADDAITRSKQ
jgi:hypothetical protein